MSTRAAHAFAFTLLLAACGKDPAPADPKAPAAPGSTTAAPGGDPKAAAPPATTSADSPERALSLYHEGLRGDFDKLWAVATAQSKSELQTMISGLAKASAAELAPFGLTAEEAAKLEPRTFFDKMQAKVSAQEKERNARPLTDVKITLEGDKAKAAYRMGPGFCEAQIVKEADGWKVDGHSCEEGG